MQHPTDTSLPPSDLSPSEPILPNIAGTECALPLVPEVVLAIVDSIETPIFVKDHQHRWLLLNDAACQLVGKSRSELIGKSDYDVFPPSEAAVFWREDAAVLESGETRINNEVLTQNGFTHSIQTTKRRFTAPDGQRFIIGTIAETTDHSQKRPQLVEQQFELSSAWYKRILSNIPGMLYQFKINATGEMSFTYVSDSCEKLFGIKASEFINNSENMSSSIHPDDIDPFNKSMVDSMVTLRPWRMEWRHINATNGTVLWLRGESIPARQADGSTIWDGILMDVTDLKLLEGALRDSEERFSAVLEAAGEYIWEMNDNWEYTFLSSRIRDVLGYQPLELIGRSILEQAQSEHHRTICQALIIAAEQGQPFGFEAVFRDKQGNTVWNHISGLPMFSSDGETIIGFRGVGLNITDRKMTEFALQKSLRQMEAALQELRRTQSQLVQSEKMSSLGQLVAGIAHEINNPTSFIYGNVNHAESYMKQMLDLINHYQVHYPQPAPDIADRLVAIDLEFVQEDFPKVIHSMRTGAERIQSIVSALQNFSRMDESEVKFANVHEGIDSTLMILSQRLNRTDGKLPIAVVKNYIDLPEINCYAGQLNQVFMNVLLNALDALDERDRQRPIEEIQQHPSQITITTSLLKISEGYGQQMVQIQIKDNGVGIPKTVRDRIFDPFFTTKPVGQGTGMGLAISYQVITEKHNGRLSCQSEPGQGTEFTILLPLNFNH